MTRLSSSVFAGLVSFALAVPALAAPRSASDVPSCGDEKHEDKDKKKDSSRAEAQCGEGKEGKDEKKDKKDPAAL